MSQRGSRSRRKVRRPSPDFRKRIVVFTEGARTEVSYLEYWARLNRRNVNVDISNQHGVPWSLVNWASRRLREERRDGRRNDGKTEYWCVFDVNSHPKIPDSIQMAKANGINVAVSNPCIELWFMLHFQDQTAHIGRRDAQSRSQQLLAWHKKALPDEVLGRIAASYEEAKKRARLLDDKHKGDGRPPRSNPSSDVWRLVDRIRG